MQALALARRAPNAHYHVVAMAAVCAALAAREADARRNLTRLLEARPDYGEQEFLRAFQFRRPEHRQLIGDAFRRLGRWHRNGRANRARRA